jgi:hypothetical protein
MIELLKLEKNSVFVFEVNMRKMMLISGKMVDLKKNKNERCVLSK